MKKIISRLVASLLLAAPFSAMGICTSGIMPGDFDIDLGKYSNWNSMMNAEHCSRINFDCAITPSHTKAGNTTERADTLDKLEALTHKFGGECLNKAAELTDKGQQAFFDVYQDDLGYQGRLWQHFEDEANRCWDHYAAILARLKDEMCTTSLIPAD